MICLRCSNERDMVCPEGRCQSCLSGNDPCGHVSDCPRSLQRTPEYPPPPQFYRPKPKPEPFARNRVNAVKRDWHR